LFGAFANHAQIIAMKQDCGNLGWRFG